MEEYKITYNKLLKRYYNGIEYLSSHSNMQEKWLPELLDILEKLGKMVDEYKITGKNILNGFGG